MNAIEIEKLTKRYRGGRGVEDVDIAVASGEIFGFIGPNGAGKSTTLRALLGLLAPTSGRARILGIDVQEDGTAARAEVGYVPSETSLYDGMSVEETLAFAARLRGTSGAKRAQLCDTFELERGRDVGDLSLGNRKKVALVMALEHEPRVLVLDEPTGGLDPLMQARLFEVLLEQQRRGVTVLFSSHVLSEVQRACSRVAILKDGRVLETSSVTQLRARQTKRVRAQLGPSGALAQCTALAGASQLERAGERVTFLYAGEIPPLLSALAKDQVADVAIDEPSLEEIFLQHYEGGSHARPVAVS